MDPKQRAIENRVLVLFSTHKDAAMCQQALTLEGISSTLCLDAYQLCRELTLGASVVVLTEESFSVPECDALQAVLRNQEPWSDIPIIALMHQRTSGGVCTPILERIGNLVLLPRPLGLDALVTAVRSGMRSRQRQYQIREYLAERTRHEEALRESEERYHSLFKHTFDGLAYCRMYYENGLPQDFIYLDVNDAFERLTGLKNVTGKRVSEVIPGIQQSNPELFTIYGRVALTGQPERFETYLESLELWFSISVYSPRKEHFVAVFENITERKRAEANRLLLMDTLQIFNQSGDLHSMLRDALRLIRERTGFDAVGLRLRQGEDCPYYQQDGFSEEFLREENFLCAKHGDGAILHDAEGRAVLECTCGLVLSGRTNPCMSCFTKGGSFWTNVASDLLALPRDDDPRINPRNNCIHRGYQSVGLFPVRGGQEIIGLLQLNDRREGRFTPESIHFYENLAHNIGLALQRTVAEDALRQSEEWLKFVLGTCHIGAWDMDIADHTTIRSPEHDRIYGYETPLPQWTYEMFLEHVVPEDRARVNATYQEAVKNQGSWGFEYRIRRPDGQVRWIWAKGSHKPEASGRPRRVAGIVLDITERKQAEQALADAKEQLQQHARNLERLVQERTAKLQETVNELEHFSYTITHDMRAPLRAMQNFAHLMLEGECTECQRDVAKAYLSRIQAAARRMDTLITDALQYSRMLRHEFPLQPVDVAPLLRSLVETYPNLQPPKVQIRIEGNFPLVLGNEAGLTQCFSNLLGNAVKFIEPGKIPQIRVWAERISSLSASHEQRPRSSSAPQISTLNPALIRIWVEDNGVGIAKEYQERIWGMFETLARTDGSTGIGLALVRKVVERMGGRTGVESEPGQGSRFWVELKAAG